MKKQTNLNSSTVWIVVISVLITAFIVGGSMHMKRISEVKNLKEASQEQITQLEDNLPATQKLNNVVPPVAKVGYNLMEDRCSTEECLFNIDNSNYPLGTATIKGYYSSVERTGWDETKTCESFTITGGSQELVRAMVDLVDQGNTIHSKNELGQPVINLGFDLLSASEKQSIKISNVNKQIELVVLSETPRGAGAPVCMQDVVVLRKK